MKTSANASRSPGAERAAIIAGALIVGLSSGCATDTPPLDPTPTVRMLSVSPERAAPGTPVRITGLDDAVLEGIARGDAVLTIGGDLAPFTTSGEELLAAVPLFYDAGAGALALPDAPVDIEVTIGGALRGEARGALTVEALPDAPGAAAAFASDLAAVIESLTAVWERYPTGPSEAAGQVAAFFGALEEISTGNGEYALSPMLAALAEEDPGALAIVEGVFAASGLVEQAALLAEFSSALAVEGGRAPLVVDEIPDWDLAARMQLYVMVRDFGNEVVAETASSFGTTVGIGAGAIGIATGGTIPLVGQISAVLTVVNFAINKVALAYLPSQITSFEIHVDEPLVLQGEVAETELWLEAQSQPPLIGIQDIVDGILLGLGLAPGSGPAQTFREFLAATADWYLGVVRSIMSAYAAQHPEVPMDVDVASIPVMHWKAKVVTDRLVERFTLTPEVITPVENIVAWRAEIDGQGEGKIYARPAIGPDVTNLPLIPGYEYNSGAFGDDIAQTPVSSIFVGTPIRLEVSMAPTISPGGINGLEARAGTVGPTGDVTWTEGILIECAATGGTVDPASGLTGSDGRFDTFVTLAEGASEVVVTVVATGDFDVQVTETASAVAIGDAGTIVLTENECSVHANADAKPSNGERCTDGDKSLTPPDNRDDFVASASASCAAADADGTCTATVSASAAQESRVFHDPFSGSLSRVRNTASGTTEGSLSECDTGAWTRGGFVNSTRVFFEVLDEPVGFTLSGTLAGYEGGAVRVGLWHDLSFPDNHDELDGAYDLVETTTMLDVAGTLEPGAYHLTLQQNGYQPNDGGSRSGAWDVELIFTP